uniref:Ras-related protein RABF2b isoform X2 n=1 Tax=Rhizophora mucronata TaxID=61149 RepID=A0A2P2JAJ0_RHIMU
MSSPSCALFSFPRLVHLILRVLLRGRSFLPPILLYVFSRILKISVCLIPQSPKPILHI